MAYELTINTEDNISSTDLNSNVSSSIDTSNLILSERQSKFRKSDATFDSPAHNHGRYYIADTVDPTPIINNFETVVANTDWAEIQGRHVWDEYNQDTYLHDETYYPYGMQNGFRSPPTIEYIDGFESRIAEAHFIIGGTEQSVTDKTLRLSKPTKYIRQDAIVVESDGSISVIEGTEYPQPKANNIDWPVRPSIPTGAKAGAYVTVKSALDRIPRSGIEIEDVVGDDGQRTVEYTHGTMPSGIS